MNNQIDNKKNIENKLNIIIKYIKTKKLNKKYFLSINLIIPEKKS